MSLHIWIASFIPKNIPNYTKLVPSGNGKTMIPGPTPVSDCFLTDQRSFDSSPTAPSRTRSQVEIEPTTLTLLSQLHHCDNTVEVDCEDGDIECDNSADTSKLKVVGFSTNQNSCSFTFAGGAGNPCAGSAAPDIDWLVHVSFEKLSGNALQVTVQPNSMVEPFPAFEMYTSFNGTTKLLFSRPPDSGATPWDLFGPPNKPVVGNATFP